MINAEQYTHIHMLGIGGVGMSGLAKHLVGKGITVTGQDLIESDITRDLSDSFSIDI